MLWVEDKTKNRLQAPLIGRIDFNADPADDAIEHCDERHKGNQHPSDIDRPASRHHGPFASGVNHIIAVLFDSKLPIHASSVFDLGCMILATTSAAGADKTDAVSNPSR